MDVIAVSPPSEYANEAERIAGLSDAGLFRYHLRKPDWSLERCARFLREVPAAYHPRISIHQHHRLAEEFKVGIHFKTSARPAPAEADRFGADGLIRSRSLHNIRDLKTDAKGLDYVFLSPVFPSISKPNYRPDWSEEALRAALEPALPSKIHALGGVTPANAGRALEFGFDGVVLHGALWRVPDPLVVFQSFGKEAA